MENSKQSAQHTPGPKFARIMPTQFGYHEVHFEDGMKRYTVNVAGNAVSGFCEYPMDTLRSRFGNGLAASCQRRLKPGPLLTKLEKTARAAVDAFKKSEAARIRAGRSVCKHGCACAHCEGLANDLAAITKATGSA